MSELASDEGPERAAARFRTYIGGIVVFDGFTSECVVRNISETGAKVELLGGQYVGERLHLIDLKHGVALESDVVWRDYPMIGLHFTAKEDLTRPGDPKLLLLRRIWMHKRELNGI